MATLAAEYDEYERGPGAAPISAHPAFSAIVALWFAALLGLGSLILPVALLERLADVTGIATLVPSAAPPLGFAAHATLSLAGAVFGAIFGLLLARQVARHQAPRPRPRFASDEGYRCKPISVHDELDEEGIGPARPRATKRRSLAIAEDAVPSEYLVAAPLPGTDPLGMGQAAEEAGDALELGAFAEQAETGEARKDDDPSMTDDANPAPPPGCDERQARDAGHSPLRAFDPLPDPEFDDEPDPVDALPFSAPSLRRVPAPEPDSEQDFGHDEAAPTAAIPHAYEPEPEPAPRLSVVDWSEEDEYEATEERPVEELGLVQLATRLGDAIERRRAQRLQRVEAAPAPRPAFGATEDFDAAEAEEAARARADFFGGPQAAATLADAAPPSSPLGEIDFDEDDQAEDADLAASFSLPLRNREGVRVTPTYRLPQPTAADLERDHDEDEFEAEAEEEYSSLLAMQNPFRRKEQFVRIDEPEPDEDDLEATVTFPEREPQDRAALRPFDPPGHLADKPAAAPRNPGEAERELRAALETLQRMSGAA